MIRADYHVHSYFSSDSDTPLCDIIRTAISKGFDTLCLTDHHDIDFPVLENGMDFEELTALRQQYADRIDLRIGVEMGLMPHIGQAVSDFVHAYPYDFVIGSSHLVDRVDPYYPAYWENTSEIEGYRRYFKTILDNTAVIHDYDVYGHLDYVVRYGPTKNANFHFQDYADIFETALKQIIADGKGIEINTAGLYKGLGYPHPHRDILRLYKELGGEIITIGSDGHITDHIGYGFDIAEQYLLDAGFRYYTIFRNRKPEFRKLGV